MRAVAKEVNKLCVEEASRSGGGYCLPVVGLTTHGSPSNTANMEIIVANVDKVTFDIEAQLEEQVGAQMLPFPGMDSKWTSLPVFRF